MIFAFTLTLMVGGVDAQTHPDTTAIDQAVLSKLSAQFGINSKIITHLDLTQPFQTKSRWSLVAAKQPDEDSSVEDGAGNRIGAVSLCFVEEDEPDCSEEMFRAKYREEKISFVSAEGPLFYELFASDVVFSGAGRTLPLLRIQSCTSRGANGNCGVSTFLFAYDQKAERFRVVFFNIMGSNNNQEARFVENGPLLGSVVVTYPTDDPPFTYFVEVYKRASGGEYSRVLRYRGNTGYGDGNPLAVIDSEMPETLRRLGLWKTGDALPVPPRMPRGCTRLVMRKGAEWCEPH
ncbi:MAG TPA: hypothetical protein VK789_33705 [Bryobacteraceae bacterium]|nr:hypothetical protein [Bryobacteraceae bacterium]